MANPRRRRGDGQPPSSNSDINANLNANVSSASSSSFTTTSSKPSTNSRRHNHHNARNGAGGRNNDTLSPSSESGCWFVTRVAFLLFIVSSIILSVYFYPYDYPWGLDLDAIDGGLVDSEDDFIDPFLDDNRTASQLLRTIVNTSNDLLIFELQLRSFLEGERLAVLLKEQLQPIQDRVTSLTTQTSGYEKMDHIPGGPTHFISTALQELDGLEENQLAKLDELVTGIILEETKMAVGMGQSVMRLFDQASFVLEAPVAPALIDEGIYISPMDELEDDPAKIESLLPKFPLYVVLPILSELANKLELKEEAYEKLQEIRKELGLRSFELVGLADFTPEEEEIMNDSAELSDAVDVLEWRAGDVEELIEEHEITLQLVLPLHDQLMKRVATLQDDLLNYATKKRRAYLNLRATVAEDVRKLKVRIQNLRYKYAKVGLS